MVQNGKVKIYLADIRPLFDETMQKKALAQLDEVRRQKALSCRQTKQRAASLTAGLLAEEAKRRNGFDGCPVCYTKNGQPYLFIQDGRRAFLSLSHSGDYAVCAFSDCPVGVDLQQRTKIRRSVLQKFVKSGEIYRFGRGLYVWSDVWEDDFYLLQRKYGRGIYSHDTALYLRGYSDRTPAKYTMTFPKGYNASSLKRENLIVKRVVPENYELGRIEMKSPSGNPIRVYNLERTLCDILRGSGSDIQIVGEAMKRYAASKDKNIHRLMQYADQLRVKPNGNFHATPQMIVLHVGFQISSMPCRDWNCKEMPNVMEVLL